MENFLENIKYFPFAQLPKTKQDTSKSRRVVFLSQGVYIDVHDQEKTPCNEVLPPTPSKQKQSKIQASQGAADFYAESVHIRTRPHKNTAQR